MQEMEEQDIGKGKNSFNDSIEIAYEEQRPRSMDDGDDNDKKSVFNASPE
jgi:hypothetical protein